MRVEAILKVLASYDPQGRAEDTLKTASGLALAPLWSVCLLIAPRLCCDGAGVRG